MTGFEGHPETDYRYSVGYFFELSVSYRYDERVGFFAGLNYNYTTLGITDRCGLEESEGDISTSYLNFPVFMKYTFSENSPVSLAIGPYVGFRLHANEKGITTLDTAAIVMVDEPDPSLSFIKPTQPYDNDIKENYTTLDFGLSAQLNYNFDITDKLSLVLFTRFNLGLADIITTDIIVKSTADTWKNYNLMIGLGFER